MAISNMASNMENFMLSLSLYNNMSMELDPLLRKNVYSLYIFEIKLSNDYFLFILF